MAFFIECTGVTLVSKSACVPRAHFYNRIYHLSVAPCAHHSKSTPLCHREFDLLHPFPPLEHVVFFEWLRSLSVVSLCFVHGPAHVSTALSLPTNITSLGHCILFVHLPFDENFSRAMREHISPTRWLCQKDSRKQVWGTCKDGNPDTLLGGTQTGQPLCKTVGRLFKMLTTELLRDPPNSTSRCTFKRNKNLRIRMLIETVGTITKIYTLFSQVYF